MTVAWLLTWYWRAERWAHAGMPFVRGHALYRPATQGGTATNDTSAPQQRPALLRGGLLPQASGYQAARRATRDL